MSHVPGGLIYKRYKNIKRLRGGVADPNFADVSFLFQPETPSAVEIPDVSPFGTPIPIVSGGVIDTTWQVFGLPTYMGTQIMPDVGSLSDATRFQRLAGEALTVEGWIRRGGLPNTGPSGTMFDWLTPLGINFLSLRWFANVGNLQFLNGTTPVTVASALAANTDFFYQITIQTDDSLTFDLDGVEIYAASGSSSANPGAWNFKLGGIFSGVNATGSTWFVGPMRVTKGVARSRGSVPTGPFPTQ